MTKFKTITQEQLDCWIPDGNHAFDVHVYKNHLVDWFENIEEEDEEGYLNDFFIKKSDDMLVISCDMPDWGSQVDRDELEQAVLEKLFLKREWVDQMPCNG